MMKRLLITLIAVCLVAIGSAQVAKKSQTIFDLLVEEYADQEGFSAVQLTSDMFELYLKKKNIEKDDPVYTVLNDLENIMVVTQTYSGDDNEEGDGLKSEILDYYSGSEYALFKTEKSPSSDLKIYLKKNDSGVKSMGLVSSNSYSVNLIEMNGKIDLANIASLDRALNIRGLEQLRVFNDKSPYDFHFNYNFEMPDMKDFEMSIEQQKEIEEQVMRHQEEMRAQQDEMRIRQREMRERSRELHEKYNRFPIILNGGEDKDAEYFVNGKKVEFDELKNIEPDEIQSIQVIKEDDSGNKANIKIQTKDKKK